MRKPHAPLDQIRHGPPHSACTSAPADTAYAPPARTLRYAPRRERV